MNISKDTEILLTAAKALIEDVYSDKKGTEDRLKCSREALRDAMCNRKRESRNKLLKLEEAKERSAQSFLFLMQLKDSLSFIFSYGRKILIDVVAYQIIIITRST